jgi:hypothetical protein
MAEESLRVSGMAVGAGDDLDDINKMLEQEEIADKAKAKKAAAAGKAQSGKEEEAAPAAKKKKAKKEKKEEAEGGEFEFAMEGGEGEEKAEFSPKQISNEKKKLTLAALQSINKVIETLEKEYKFSPLSTLNMKISHFGMAMIGIAIFVLTCIMGQYRLSKTTN